jgi:2-polyprenyl-6-methoxyphenol hydroxylase-like FAD-dependent oxidoreductase
MTQTTTSVLIVGGGPIGLALAAGLGRRGVRTLLVEQSDDVIGSAKMIEVSVRTMEFCRQLGISEAVRHWGFPDDHRLDSVFVTDMQGYEIGRIHTPSLGEQQDSEFSPERNRPCPQTWFDPILQKCARSFPSVELRYRTRLDRFEQNTDGVSAWVTTPTGEQQKIRADYLVGCDGYTSTVRQALGIEMRGDPHLDLSMSVYIRIKNFESFHDKAQGYRYVFLGPEGVRAALTTIDGHDLYRLQLIGVPDRDLDKIDIASTMQRCIGRDIPFTIEDTSFWVRKMVIADRFMDGRVFLAGDSCHAHPPNGGLGMNTGIQDSFDLAWKLAAVLKGWGGPTLLDSYDYERRPASSRAAIESLRNFRRLTDNTSYALINDPGPDADALRKSLGVRLVAENEKAWHPVGVHLGYIYNPSPVVVPDGTNRPPDDRVSYAPTTYPGARAPHVWLEDGRSILDLFGNGFCLLKFAAVDTGPLEHAARLRNVPLVTCHIKSVAAAALYQKALVMVRPDGHVAWRGDACPINALEAIDTIRGAGPRIAAGRAGEHDAEPVRGEVRRRA